MGITTKRAEDGTVLWFDVLAGKVQGRRIRKRFTVGRARIADPNVRRARGLKASSTQEEHALAAAKLWEEQQRDQLLKARYEVASIPQHQIGAVLRALEMLELYERTIDDVVADWIRLSRGEVKQPWNFAEAVRACIQHKRDMQVTEAHLRPLEVKLTRIALEFGSRLCDDITTEELETYARRRARTAHTWRNYRRDLGIVFNFAMQRGRANCNPAKNMPKPQFSDRPPIILSVVSVRKLLQNCNVTARPHIALGLFAGLRPFETVRIQPDHINISNRLLTVTGKRTRSRSRRHVQLSTNLCEWLANWTPKPLTYWRVRSLIQDAGKAAGITLAPDVLRHSFASHHLALHRNPGLTAHEMGHRDQEMLYRHYRDLVSHEEGRAYFEISPSSTLNSETPYSAYTVAD